ncbi:hydrogenase formation protein HypD [Bacillus tuaregi]|uniref:hydrogenase formation protein HypD n=1 Tax=Bacillus tuaregi TaxID=1816695 RepID=UPI000A0753BB|nr:hydrogenase formation protein HypD [Bacillus tuaregi]
MCVAAFGMVTERVEGRAVVSFKGALKEVSTALLPNVKIGDTVVVHAGFATEIVKNPHKIYRDVVATDAYARQLLDGIEKENKRLRERELKIMNFCGTHENTIVQYGLRELLPANIQLISGPGCPVCVTPEEEIALGIELANRKNIILTTYGDLLRVPTRWGTLAQLKQEGKDVRIVYDISQSLELAKNTDSEVVHMAVGFETTAPGTASVIQQAGSLENYSILSSHRITPPAMEEVLLHSNMDILLCPGHVAMVTGTAPFDLLVKKYRIPCVISGFEPVDILHAILQALYHYDRHDSTAINQYQRVVKDKGNGIAQNLIQSTFTLTDANWRGVGFLPQSRLVLKHEFSQFDAEIKYNLKLAGKEKDLMQTCLCGEVLKGMKPQLCPNFGHNCTPATPTGPCMVTQEGACSIAYMNLGVY